MRLPAQLLHRKIDANKGDFGHILILAGSGRYSGAAVLCAKAALRSGAGLVTIGIPKSLNTALIRIKPLEAMTLPLPETKNAALSFAGYLKIKEFSKNVNLIVIGPGLSRENSTKSLIRKIVLNSKHSLVVDADAINAFSGELNLLRERKFINDIIITPHPGEMSRLISRDINEIQKIRKVVAKKLAIDIISTVVFKGHRTIVTDFKGKVYINKTGNPGMATAGSGDCLAGIIAAFKVQGLDSFKAAKFGVYIHGLAADIAALKKSQLSLIASDIIDYIPEALKRSSVLPA